ncbi:hypothetical protein PG994_001781 [Apiospora phragmitis]|uniref:Prolyl 4-hydroxylase alpha subunit domain-containing protein n=1 Tax=Apiospora phragmitis TaxID=2905665 RepID=A0ABR1WUN0_9PEZI
MAESIYRSRFSVWAAVLAVLALSAPWTFGYIAPYTTTEPILRSWGGSSSFVCDPHHAYTTTIISLDPPLLYLTTFLSPSETAALLSSGARAAFAPSHVYKHGRRMGTPDRTSHTAGLPRDDPAVRCILARAQAFLGPALFDPRRDDIGPPQLVRYAEGQRFNVHHDWYETAQPPARGEADAWRGRSWNRVASFFAVLEDGCEGGETWFPRVEPPTTVLAHGGDSYGVNTDDRLAPIWRAHEDGGVAFRPVAGNALFWVNLHTNGTGDRRTLHAGLPVDDGLKTAMNIWPRKYYK